MNDNLKIGVVFTTMSFTAIIGLIVMGISIFTLGTDILPIGIAIIFVFFTLCGCTMFFASIKNIVWQLWKPKEK